MKISVTGDFGNKVDYFRAWLIHKLELFNSGKQTLKSKPASWKRYLHFHICPFDGGPAHPPELSSGLHAALTGCPSGLWRYEGQGQ